ncbi:MAG: DUF1186 domain-containing protein [Treponema sp.]|jgi:hypothetical protein|nr:DUF1186 domain-containing protein [Treponema sp.]
MTSDAIINALMWQSTTFPRQALLEAAEHREELIPRLLEALDYIHGNGKQIMRKKSNYDLHFYALFLLAQFGEKRAFPLLVRLLKENEETLDFFWGDALLESYSQCLCRVYDGGGMEPLKEIIEDAGLYEYARSAAIDACALIYRDGQISREELAGYFRYLTGLLRDDLSYTPTALVSVIADIHLFELIPDVKALYGANVIDESVLGGFDGFLNDLFDYHPWHEKEIRLTSALEELQGWAKYREEPKPAKPKPAGPSAPDDAEAGGKKKKTGRNDPCPCGSGKKYKKCCLLKGIDFTLPVLPQSQVQAQDRGGPDPLAGLFAGTGTGAGERKPGVQPYDLLTGYPCLDEAEAERRIEAETAGSGGGKKYAGWRPKNQRFITEFYSPKAITIDIPVYKALYRRSIPLWVKRNPRQEDLERIALLREALALFTQTCAEEGIETFADFDRKYMVHYESARWVRRLQELLEKYRISLPETDRALQDELAAMLERMRG